MTTARSIDVMIGKSENNDDEMMKIKARAKMKTEMMM